jgi:hypothetical protein
MSTTVAKTHEEETRAWFVDFRETTIRHLRNLVAGKPSKDSGDLVDVYFMCLPAMIEDEAMRETIFNQVRSLEATAPLLKAGTPAMRRQYEEESFMLFSTLRRLAR